MSSSGNSKLDPLLMDAPWPVGLAARMIAASSYPNGRPLEVGSPPPSPELPGDVALAHSLPASRDPSRPGRALFDVINGRRSGGIEGGPLGQAELGTLLAATATTLPNALLPTPALRPIIFPLIFNVEGLLPAVYRYEPAGHMLHPIRAIQRDVVRDDVLLQWEHGEGAAVLFMVVPMAHWLHHFGDRGYRGVAFQVGYITDRLYIAAERLGLTYTASGGFAPARADALLGLDEYHYTTMFSFVVGGPNLGRLDET